MSKRVKRTNIPVSIRTRMEKIYSYIKYCQRLEDAYRTKHEEVKTLNEYLKRIQRVLPENVSTQCPEVGDIITYIEGLPDIPDTDDLNDALKRMIEQQREWREESAKNYNLINRKIETLTEARDVVSISNNEKTTQSKRMVIDGVNVIPFSKDKYKIYGGSFLSQFKHLKNHIKIQSKEYGELSFCCIRAALVYYKVLYIKDKDTRKQFVKKLSGDSKLGNNEINQIEMDAMKLISRNQEYESKWNSSKYDIMKKLTSLKFENNRELNDLLKETGESYLIQVSGNKYWGSGVTGNGKNMLGRILMEVRSELFNFKNVFDKISVRDVINGLGEKMDKKVNLNIPETRKRKNTRSRKINKIKATKKKNLGK